MAIYGEVWIDLDAVLAAARDSRTSPDACQRLLAFLSGRRDSISLLVGTSTDREQLLRIYRRRARRALPDGRFPDGTHELVRQLEHETGSEIVLIALSSAVQFAYIFVRQDLRSRAGSVVGEPSPRFSQRRARIEHAPLTRSADTSSPELAGVVTVDLEPDEHSINYEIMAWGDVVAHKPTGGGKAGHRKSSGG